MVSLFDKKAGDHPKEGQHTPSVDGEHFSQLQDIMHQADKKRTLEEQVAYLKSQGIDPKDTYAKWDDDEEEDWWLVGVMSGDEAKIALIVDS